MPLFKFNRFLCLIKTVNKLSIHILVLCVWMESGWLPGLFPIKIWWKLNTDGSSLGILGKAGAGVLIRREDGDWVVGFSTCSGETTKMILNYVILLKKKIILI